VSAGGPRPTAAFDRVDLDIAEVAPGTRFSRIFLDRYPNPLGFGKAASRFSDPRRRVERNRFGVLYLGSSLKVCFLEAILRDRRNGAVGDHPIEERELRMRRYAEVVIAEKLALADLRGDGRVRMGIPSSVAGAASQALARAWSLALHEHRSAPDGIIYASRLNGEGNLAVFDRAIAKLRVARDLPLIAAPGLAAALDDLRVALV